MRRRNFIAGLAGAATWPLTTRAQQAAMPVIGFLRSTTSADSTHLATAFRQGLTEAGFVEGQNVAIEYRYADNQTDRLPALASDLIRRPVAVIVGASVAMHAVKAATTAVPIVFVGGSDPIQGGLVASLNRPGGNVTGVAFLDVVLAAKRLELLRQLLPKTTTIAALMDTHSPTTEVQRRELQAAAHAIGQQLFILNVASERDIEPAFATSVQRGAGALFASAGPFLFSKREQLVALAARHALPASYSLRDFPVAGGLMSYGTSLSEAYRQAGTYVGRILKGEKPADLPVLLATKFEFVINLRTAKTLGIEFHPQLLATADEVIE